MRCEMPQNSAGDEQIRALLHSAHTIAVVGASDKAERDSFHITQFLAQVGYVVYPVNPNYERVAELTCLDDLSQIDQPIDIVNVFRRPDAVDAIAEAAIAAGAGALWLQEGVVNNAAAERACEAGLTVVQNRCIYKDYVAHFGEGPR